jgi:hypothetical protein
MADTEGEAGPHVDPETLGHPRGTLVIVALFGLLFGLGWLAFYVWLFLGRGAPHS